jgi:hypothetical protein
MSRYRNSRTWVDLNRSDPKYNLDDDEYEEFNDEQKKTLERNREESKKLKR